MAGKTLDLEAEYNNRAAVPDHPAVMARWKADAEAARAAHPPTALPYGSGEREVMDLFEAGPDAPVAVFIHGGYWQALDRSWFSWIAPAFLKHGVSLAVPSYDLCPDVRLGRIIGEIRDAVALIRTRTGRRPVVLGHSAGGHLAACMLATDWPAYDVSLPPALVIAAYSISGLFDLGPLVETSINKALHLDPAAARAASPLFWDAPKGGSLDAVVGENESAEYFRQSRTIVEAWGAAGTLTRFGTVSGANHFTAIAPLADPGSLMVLRLKQLAGR